MTPPTPYDTGNPLLEQTPCHLVTAVLNVGAHQRLALTVRTPSTTVTVLLTDTDAQKWADQIADAITAMTRSGLIIANGHLPKPQTP